MRRAHSLAFLLALIQFGCSGGSKDELPTYKAQGTVQMDGKPFGPCTLTLEPSPVTEKSRSAIAMVDATGKFSAMRTYRPGDGIPEGTYTVKLVADAMGGPAVPGFDSKSVVVTKPGSGPVQLSIDLTSNKGPSNDLPREEMTAPVDVAPPAL